MKSQLSNYKQHLISMSKSENTIRNYTKNVTHYFEEFDVINRENILKYKKKISDLATSTINCKLSSLKSFNEYLMKEKIVGENFVIKADFVHVQQQGNPTDITEEEVSKFLSIVNEKYHIYKSRNVAIIYLIANTGIRREECSNIKLKDIDLKNGELLITKGKGNKQRVVLLNDKAIEVVSNWLKDRKNYRFCDSDYLFISERCDKLHKDSINGIFEYYWTDDCKVRPHRMRHNYSSSMIEHGILTLPELQSQLGHSSVGVTSRYLHARKNTIKKKINNFNIE